MTDSIYRERAHLVAHLAALYESNMVFGADPAEPDWPVVYVYLPTGQASWHISPEDVDLFDHVRRVPTNAGQWDGHDTTEKYRRVDAATEAVAKESNHG